MTLPSGTGVVSAYTYDDADRLTGIDHVKGGSTTLAFVDYTLDDVGNRTQRVDDQGTHTYVYDDLYRLTSVTYPGPTTTTYDFDAFGNRTELVDGGGTTTYDYDDADRLVEVTKPGPTTVIYDWDDNGNLTDRDSDEFTWDFEDRMTSATVNSVTTTSTYRGNGLRNSRTVGGGSPTVFTWDIAASLAVVLDDGNQYVYGAAGLTSMKQSGDWYYYLADGLGSTMAMVDDTGTVQKSYTYDVYGEASPTGGLANEFDFAGEQSDASTGLQYLRARYMDPETGTFISRDPLTGSVSWLGSSFAYAQADPCGSSDPTGLVPGEKYCKDKFKKLLHIADRMYGRFLDYTKMFNINPSGRAGHLQAYQREQWGSGKEETADCGKNSLPGIGQDALRREAVALMLWLASELSPSTTSAIRETGVKLARHTVTSTTSIVVEVHFGNGTGQNRSRQEVSGGQILRPGGGRTSRYARSSRGDRSRPRAAANASASK